MKKTLVATSIFLGLNTVAAQAGFTPLPDGSYQVAITGGCFDFGNCQTSGRGILLDNTTANQADASSFGSPFGSGIVNDGLVGLIDFNLTGGNISVTAFSQDSYLGTAGGTFYLRSLTNDTMSGNIDSSGNMTLLPAGRVGAASAFATTIGEQPWNIDNTSDGFGTGLYAAWTTGTSSNRTQGLAPGFTLNGAALQDAGAGVWNGTLVSAGNIGAAWGAFDNTQYSEVYNVTISATEGGPIPRVTVGIAAQGGTPQECTGVDGSTITFLADVALFNGGQLSTLEWVFDGESVSVGTEPSLAMPVSLGSHSMDVVATLITGQTDTDSQSISIKDTQPPELMLGFIDRHTGQSITEIADNQTHRVEIQLEAKDACDPNPVTNANVVPVFAVEDGDVIKVKGKKGKVIMPTTALSLTGTATDATGHSKTGNTTLLITR